MYQDACYDRDDINNNFFVGNINNYQDTNSYNNNYPENVANIASQPIIEGVQERQVHRTIVHEVPHVCPIRTRIINHHIYKHTYRPEYSCCEENVVSNIGQGCCGRE